MRNYLSRISPNIALITFGCLLSFAWMALHPGLPAKPITIRAGVARHIDAHRLTQEQARQVLAVFDPQPTVWDAVDKEVAP